MELLLEIQEDLVSLDKIKQVVRARPGEIMFGLNLIVHKGRTISCWRYKCK